MDINKIKITDILAVMTVFSPKGRTDSIHHRSCYGLSFTADGEILYTHKGQTYLSDRHHAVILPKGQSYSLQGTKKGTFPVINFDCEGFVSDEFIVLPISHIEPILKDFEYLKNRFFREENRLLSMSILYKMLYDLVRGETLLHSPLSPALAYLEQNLSFDITNATLAETCSMSEEYFRKQFKKNYGLSPKQYVIDLRIAKAKQLLTDGILKVQAVSEQCGFSNPYHFCRLFKEKTGLTPTEFMNTNKTDRI